MKKIINNPSNYVDEIMSGVVKAHASQVKLSNDDKRILLRNEKKAAGKVAIVTGGGSGHLPLFMGYVGDGMLDGCAVGNVFASPSSDTMAKMIRECDTGAGVVCLFGNYGGDRMNFDMACEEVEFDDINTAIVIANDDIASSSVSEAQKRRGVAGIVYSYKIAGAAAELGASLEEVVRVAKKTISRTRTIGFALSPCTIPEVGRSSFSINEDEIEIGMGIHGEKGIEVRKMMSADEIAKFSVDALLTDLAQSKIGGITKLSVMINGLGATPLDEQYIVYNKVCSLLNEKGIEVIQPHIGEFATSMEMAGLSITFVVLDEEMEKLLKEVAKTPFYTNYNM